MAELAIQIKDRTSNNGAQRVYTAMLGDSEPTTAERANSLRFLAQCLRSVDPSPQRVRELTRRIFEKTRLAEQADISGLALTGLRRTYTFAAT